MFRRAGCIRDGVPQVGPLEVVRVVLLDDSGRARKHLGTNVLLFQV
ncbi:hypothetical protein RISK_000833 [Rhodopirellula islandica]|uniref:Uncharacterized protein n=1 Tax=Rhodopirellula islandica TaxID=595434 RepID=A0A0J1BKK1_RHOIS|nr:hypothetical protein RISK_000833 [Rhodopirellula islandica]